MHKHVFESRLHRLLHRAHLRGIGCPIIGVFDPCARRAAEIYCRVHGRRPPARWRSHRKPLPEGAYSTGEAAGWLRLHGGIGGWAIANFLETTPAQPDYWLLLLLQKAAAVIGAARNGFGPQGGALYDDLPFRLCDECLDAFADTEVLPFVGADGSFTEVGGENVVEAERALDLVEVVHRRGLQSLPAGENAVDLPVDDDLLTMILRVLYGASPGAVVEALRALRAVDGEGRAWLWRVLRSRPELRGLARMVKKELRR